MHRDDRAIVPSGGRELTPPEGRDRRHNRDVSIATNDDQSSLEDGQLMAKDKNLDVVVPALRRAGRRTTKRRTSK